MTELNYTPVENRLRVCHYPQIPCKPFRVSVNNEWEAYLVFETLAKQHLWLFKNGFIPDYSNVIMVEMWAEVDDNKFEWIDYWNDAESMEWDEFKQTYFEK